MRGAGPGPRRVRVSIGVARVAAALVGASTVAGESLGRVECRLPAGPNPGPP